MVQVLVDLVVNEVDREVVVVVVVVDEIVNVKTDVVVKLHITPLIIIIVITTITIMAVIVHLVERGVMVIEIDVVMLWHLTAIIIIEMIILSVCHHLHHYLHHLLAPVPITIIQMITIVIMPLQVVVKDHVHLWIVDGVLVLILIVITI
jgi:hypothetical protein